MAPLQMPKKNQPIFPLFVPIKVRLVHHLPHNHHLMFFCLLIAYPSSCVIQLLKIQQQEMKMKLYEGAKKFFK
jgi:hypothetical protein